MTPPRPTQAVLRLPTRLCRDQDVRACVRPVVCYRWCRSCLPVCSRLQDYYTPDDIPFSQHLRPTFISPTCERTHPTRPEKTLDSALRNYQAILRHSFTRPVASIATSATKRPSKDRTYDGLPSACALCYARAAGTGLCMILEGLYERIIQQRPRPTPHIPRYRHRQTVAKGLP